MSISGSGAEAAKLRAAQQFKKKREADKAMSDWEKARQAETEKTARLKALRLARDAAEAEAARNAPPVVKPVKRKAKAPVAKVEAAKA